jgi:signal transduction histidine kinase/GAF domain-containing protein
MTSRPALCSPEALYEFVEVNHDFLLVVDDQEQIVHASLPLQKVVGRQRIELIDRPLEVVVTPDSLGTIQQGLAQERKGNTAVVIFSPSSSPKVRVPLKTHSVGTGDARVCLLYGTQADALKGFEKSEQEDRIRQLSCLYAIADWTDRSTVVDEFFQKLPPILARGVQFPDQAVVCSSYLEQEYGKAPFCCKDRTGIRTALMVNGEKKGTIGIGYVDPDLGWQPEEQRMLDQIGRLVSLALERKELSGRLESKRAEEERHRERMAELEARIARRTAELDEMHQRLATVDAYRESLGKNWEASKAWLEPLFKAIPEEVALIDSKHRVVASNKEGCAEGAVCHVAIFDRESPCDDCRLESVLTTRAPVTQNLKRGDRYLEVHALPIYDEAHEVGGIMEFFKDVTLEKTYEKQLRQADRLASLGQLVSGIGHEINNPNQFIRGNIKIMRQTLEDILPIVDKYAAERPGFKVARLPYAFFREHIMVLVQDMAHGSERIKGIVEGLKRFARRDEGLLIDQVHLNTLVEACARLVHNEVHRHATIELDLEPEIPIFTGNAQKLEQVLVNLVVNASQAMPEDSRGTIRVRTRLRDDHMVLEVKDDGKGMTKQVSSQIFDPFFTTKRARGGTGLGLAITHRIVEEHGGTIDVDSKIGKGTTFTVRLPIAGPGLPASGSKA